MSDDVAKRILAALFFIALLAGGIVCEVLIPYTNTDGVAEHGWWVLSGAVIGFWGGIFLAD